MNGDVNINTKNLDFFMECCNIPVLLWKRVWVSWGYYILKTATARHSNVVPFDSEYYSLLSDNIISTSKFNGLRDIQQITKCDQYDKLFNNSKTIKFRRRNYIIAIGSNIFPIK